MANFLRPPWHSVFMPWHSDVILTLKSEQSGEVGSSPSRAPLLEHHDKGLQTPLGLLYFWDPSAQH